MKPTTDPCNYYVRCLAPDSTWRSHWSTLPDAFRAATAHVLQCQWSAAGAYARVAIFHRDGSLVGEICTPPKP